MKKIIKFSKPIGNLLLLKKDFYLNNKKYLENSIKINNKYKKQKKRTNCKICFKKLPHHHFKSHNINYTLCKKCNHLNGGQIDTDKFMKWLYKDDKGKNYSKNYLKNYDKRVKAIYLPKVRFLKDVIKKEKINILDFGSGGGHFLKACEIQNIKARGYEPNEILCSLGKKKLKNNSLINVSMDYIFKKILDTNANCLTLIGVLEHLQNPHKIFEVFKESKIKYMMISVPLFSLTSIIEHTSPKLFPRLLSAGHTHLFTKDSLDFMAKKYKLKVIGEWWFGLDFADLYRNMIVASNNNQSFVKILDKYFLKFIDDFQSILDKNKVSNEVHLIFKK